MSRYGRWKSEYAEVDTHQDQDLFRKASVEHSITSEIYIALHFVHVQRTVKISNIHYGMKPIGDLTR